MTEQKTAPASGSTRVLLAVSWLWVGIPFAIGVYELAIKAAQLFS